MIPNKENALRKLDKTKLNVPLKGKLSLGDLTKISRTCTKCGGHKHISAFGKSVHGKDGYAAQCKECVNKYNRMYFKNKRAKLKRAAKRAAKMMTNPATPVTDVRPLVTKAPARLGVSNRLSFWNRLSISWSLLWDNKLTGVRKHHK